MSASRVQALKARHAALEKVLADEMKRPQPNLAAVRVIKQRKLLLKDELAEIERELQSA